jgi:hypothetical protein
MKMRFIFHLERNRINRRDSDSRSRVWHSQTTSTFHPSRRSLASVRLSRAAFPSRFFFQYAPCRTGGFLFRWQTCMCQKQPWTLMILRSAGSTISGDPGRSRRCRCHFSLSTSDAAISQSSSIIEHGEVLSGETKLRPSSMK